MSHSISLRKQGRPRPVVLANAEEPSLDISSLIDVSFLLLIYFLVTMTLTKKEVDVDMQMAREGVGTPIAELAPMLVQLRSDGGVTVNPTRGAVDLGKAADDGSHPQLFEALSEYQAAADRAHTRATVMVQAENDANNEAFVGVLNSLQAAGISDLILDAE